MDYRDQVKQCKLDHPDWGRRKISAAAQKWAVLLSKKGCEQVFKNHILFKCKTCGCEFTIPKEWIKATTNWVGCPLHGKHNKTVVIGAYDSLRECMQAGEIDLSKL